MFIFYEFLKTFEPGALKPKFTLSCLSVLSTPINQCYTIWKPKIIQTLIFCDRGVGSTMVIVVGKNEAVCKSLRVNATGKSKNPSLLSQL